MTPDAPDLEPNLIPSAYFSGDFNKTQQLWNTTQKECYTIYWLMQNYAFYLTGMECTLCCEHKPLELFFTTGKLNHILDQWVLELQQFNI